MEFKFTEEQLMIRDTAQAFLAEVSTSAAVREAMATELGYDEQLWQRIAADPKSSTTRPNLSSGGLEEVVEMLARRSPTYERCANITLDGELAPGKLADKIVERVNQFAGS